ncbi:MAG: hypothetical protein KGY70_14300 [Bacteroidales bacterium]|nr:hypothetical protein [Bacteroidales bacterium]
MKKIYGVIVFVIGFCLTALAQEEKSQDFGIRFNGYVKNDAFFDSRQNVTAREGHFLLWPKPEAPDANQQDVNAQPNFNILAVQSRISGTITGPEALGAETSGKIEGDFFAQANDNINLFRLRHAYVRLSWENTQLLTGQFWNPMFVTSCFPGTVSFNTGVPIQPFSRNPQLRLTQNFGDFEIIAAALAQRDYPSRIDETVSSKFLRNSGTPDMHLQVHYNRPKLNMGAGLAYKTIVPRLVTEEEIKTNNTVGGLSAIAFARLSLNPITIKIQAVSGQNATDVLQISGFAVESIQDDTDKRSYLPLRNMSLWTDIHTNGGPFQFGVFAGYTKNRGTKQNIINDPDLIMGFGKNIASLYRISPRILYSSGKLKFGLEGEYTSATFGDGYNQKAIPINTHTVGNMRVLLSTYYHF